MKIKEDSPEFQERKAEYVKKLEPWADRIRDWRARHPHHAVPIHIDEKGDVHWLNREMRRKFKRK